MKLTQTLSIDNVVYPIVSNSLILEMHTPGRGVVTVQASEKLSGIVRYFLGYNNNTLQYFTGYIESSRQIDAKQQRLCVRELSAALSRRMPLALRHVTAEDILQELTALSGVNFILQDAAWNNIQIPQVINCGTGYDLLDFLGAELKIKNYVWQQQPEGSIYVGSWQGLPMGGTLLELPAECFTDMSIDGASIQAVPKLRPGWRLKIGTADPVFVSRVEVCGSVMRINWDLNPWSKQ